MSAIHGFLSFLLSTHSVDCAVWRCLFYCLFTALIVPFSSVHRPNCALFLQFAALIVPFWRSVHRTKCALFRWHPALLKTWAEHWSSSQLTDRSHQQTYDVLCVDISGYFLGARPASLAHTISYWRTNLPTFGPLGAPGAHRLTFRWALMQFLHSLKCKLFVI